MPAQPWAANIVEPRPMAQNRPEGTAERESAREILRTDPTMPQNSG
jgi:hypothetical protein